MFREGTLEFVLCLLSSAQQAIAAAAGLRGAGWKGNRSPRAAACGWEGPAPSPLSQHLNIYKAMLY